MIRCPFCHFENEEGALFCEQCKSDLGAMTPEPAPEAMPMAAEPIDEGAPGPLGETLPLQGEPTDPFAGSDLIPVATSEPGEPVPLAEEKPPEAIPEASEVPLESAEAPPEAPPAEPVAAPTADAPPSAAPVPEPPPVAAPTPPPVAEPPFPASPPAAEAPAAPSMPEPAAAPAPAAPAEPAEPAAAPAPAAPTATGVPEAEAAPPLPTDAQPRLLVLRGLKRNMEYPLYEGLNFLGRADEKPVDIDLEDQEPPDRIWCSRQHACINWEGVALSIEDLGSANGTYVNRSRIYPGQKRPLAVNDVIQIGTVQLKVLA
jgi:hypothetical protein